MLADTERARWHAILRKDTKPHGKAQITNMG